MKIFVSINLAILSCSMSIAQAAPAKTPATSAPKPAAPASTPAATALSPTTPVITITGLCEPSAPAGSCTRTITKAEFEKLADSLKVPEAQRRNFAGLYVQLLAMANEGQKLGAEKDPSFEERLRLERLRLLAQMAEIKLQESTKPTHEQIQSFYNQNQQRFEQVALRRITIPKTMGGQSNPTETKALAEKIQQRAAAGEDPDKLQKEVWLTTKATGAPPSTSQGLKRRGMMDPRHEAQILQLKDGQVTPVIEDGQSYYIYKVDSKRTIPLSEVEKDISEYLQQQQFQDKVKQILSSAKADLSDAYFGPPQPTPGEELPEPKHPAPAPEGNPPPKTPTTPPK